MWVLLATVAGWACSYDGPGAHTLDPASTDAVAPSAATVTIEAIYRGYQETVLPGSCKVVGGCEGAASISLAVSATDDEAPDDQLGYRVEIEGDAPDLAIGPDAVRAQDGAIALWWEDGESNDQEPLAFTLRVFAVDLAGNEGPPTEIAVDDPGGAPPVPPECAGGCTTTGATPGAWWIAALLAVSRRRST